MTISDIFLHQVRHVKSPIYLIPLFVEYMME